MVFQELPPAQSHKIKSRDDLESELCSDISSSNGSRGIRDNEGEAAEHGIYFDDTEYDYMQHVRDLNAASGNGESVFVEAKVSKKEKKGKGKVSLEEALREASLQEQQSEKSTSAKGNGLFGEDVLPSKDLKQYTYQNQQDVPDALAGFQPDMDPRLREVLEALDDNAYVDDEETFFGDIMKDGEEIAQDEFESTDFIAGEEEDGWESDTTEKPATEYSVDQPMQLPPTTDAAMFNVPPQASDHDDGAWMEEFSKFKADKNLAPKTAKSPPQPADLQSSILTGTSSLTNGRHKKRKGAMTSSTGYSMTSSSLARTEGQTVLDARFDKIEEEYADDDGDIGMNDYDNDTASIFSKHSKASNTSNLSRASNLSSASNMSGLSTASSQAAALTSAGFDGIMDEFLGGYSMSGKRRVKKGVYQSGIEQLDEVRRGLGPAKIKGRVGKA